MFGDDPFDLVEFARREAVINREGDRIDPELRLIFRRLDVNMRGFLPFVTEEIEAEPPYM